MKRLVLATTFATLTLALLAVPSALGAQEDLFEEAGHSLARSRWITIRQLPGIEIALESDDVVLVESKNHAPRGIAMRIDGEAVATDCEVTDQKDLTTEYTYGTRKDDDDDDRSRYSSTTNEITTTTYHASCRFPQGTTLRAVQAREITVQMAMPDGTTNAKHLSSKQLLKFQRLDK